MQFRYEALERKGDRIKGLIEADDEPQALGLLKKKNLNIISLKPVKFFSPVSNKVKTSELLIFTKLFHQLVKAKIPILNALKIIQTTLKDKKLIFIIEDIQKDLSSGKALPVIFKKYPKVFSPFYTTVLEAGQNSGKLADVLEHLYQYLYRANELKKNILSAMIYPVLVTTMAIIVLIGIVLFLVPQFQALFAQFDYTLPLLTRMVIGFNLFLKKYLVVIFLFFCSVILLLYFYFRTTQGKMIRDKLMFHIPLFSPFIKESLLARLSRMMGILIENEVDIIKSLGISSQLMSNTLIQGFILQLTNAIKKGTKVSEAFSQNNFFPNLMVQMIKIGEETGDFSEMFLAMAQVYEENLEMRSKILLSVIQPILILITGLIIMFIMVSIFLPIFQLSNVIK